MTLVAIPACLWLVIRSAPLQLSGFDLVRAPRSTMRLASAASRLLALSLSLYVFACGRDDGIKGSWKMSDADKAGNVVGVGLFPSLRCPVALTFTDATMATTLFGPPHTVDVTFRRQGGHIPVVLHNGNVLTFTRSGDALLLEAPEKCRYHRSA